MNFGWHCQKHLCSLTLWKDEFVSTTSVSTTSVSTTFRSACLSMAIGSHVQALDWSRLLGLALRGHGKSLWLVTPVRSGCRVSICQTGTKKQQNRYRAKLLHLWIVSSFVWVPCNCRYATVPCCDSGVLAVLGSAGRPLCAICGKFNKFRPRQNR
jgi:hypothetical protein